MTECKVNGGEISVSPKGWCEILLPRAETSSCFGHTYVESNDCARFHVVEVGGSGYLPVCLG